MHWVKERLMFGWDALGIIRGCITSLPLGIYVFLKWASSTWRGFEVDNVMGLSSGVFVAILTLFLITVFFLEYIVKLRKKLTPKIRLEFPNDGGSRIVTPAVQVQMDSSSVQTVDISAVYIRGKVITLTNISVKNVRAFLVNVKEKGGTGKWTETRIIDPIELIWSYIGGTEIEVFHNVPRYFDILKIDSSSKKLEIAAPYPLILKTLFQNSKHYRLHLLVIGEGVTNEKIEVEITVGDSWDKIEGKVVNVAG